MSADGASDLHTRRRALDPALSFIVQAPAGSGKTELLIQRYLVLLAGVGRPEEIAAITFTRKAAAEMRRRVIAALESARTEVCPSEPHRALTWVHARAAAERDRACGWKLEENSHRLRIQTIDALAASLTRQMPVAAGFGAQPQIVEGEDAVSLYREAARATLALLEDRDAEASRDVARLLAHLDNDLPRAQELLVRALAGRDRWLRTLARVGTPCSDGIREKLEEALAAECRLRISAASALLARAGYAPLPRADDVVGWQQLARELLTHRDEWRKTSKAAQALAGNEALRRALAALKLLPPTRYSDSQWDALEAIVRLLPRAVAQLKVVFAAHNQADFVEVAQGALAALGTADAPTDLLLSLDHRIHHILVDEFQDTSFTQFELLERLTAGWQPGDGRTLFLVGDPMQSIYGFREAEVGLFLKAGCEGIGAVKLERLTLSANFRSQAALVDWVNDAFERILPREEDIGSGAVPYVACVPVHPSTGEGVRVHASLAGDPAAEAEAVAQTIEAVRRENPGGTIALLVRNRSYLGAIVPELRARGLRFRAIEIEPLGHRQVVQDLLALTRALAHPGDRLAWLAVLRAPWCGMTLADLEALCRGAPPARNPRQDDLFAADRAPAPAPVDTGAAGDERPTLWEAIRDPRRCKALCADGRARLARFVEAITPAIEQRLRGSLRERVEGAWYALGGPACVADETDLEDAEIYFDCLESCEQAGECDFERLDQAVAALYALPDLHADETLQIMTIHKAKGLEFDTVIVPGLGRAQKRHDPELFLWMERAAESAGVSRLLLAPIREVGGAEDPIYRYVQKLQEAKRDHEEARLLYVAATRARSRLFLFGSAAASRDGAPMPRSDSLLARLWPAVAQEFAAAAARAGAAPATRAPQRVAVDQTLRRLPLDWALPPVPPPVRWEREPAVVPAREEVEFSWAGETARHIGTVTHRWLCRIAADALAGWDRSRIARLQAAFRRELTALGVPETELTSAAASVAAALAATLSDPRGRWVLGPHPQAASEYRVRVIEAGELRTLAMDRVFKSEEGERWIVDFKTGRHEGGDPETFLDRERERYRAQLERYARALGEPGEIRLGLYFPLLGGWREWTYRWEPSRDPPRGGR